MILAVIPARAGSKRLPGKNIKPLGGKPLIQWSIDAALESAVFDRVCVSTDSEEIANLARDFGAEVPFIRPSEYASDVSTTASALTHFLKMFEFHEKTSIDYVCLLQPTSPLRTAEDIRGAYNILTSGNVDAVISVCELDHPINWSNRLGPNGSMVGFIDPSKNYGSQNQEIYYRLNGAIYFCRSTVAMNLDMLYSDRVSSRAFIMEKSHSVDIDTALDFEIAESIVKWRRALGV